MPIQTSDNKYGIVQWLVNPIAGQGTHTTISAALSDPLVVAGETIYVSDGVYTENPILKAGVDLVAFNADSQEPNVVINGKLQASFVGTCSVCGIELQTNSDFALSVTGSSATIVNLTNCNINAVNNTAISYTSSSASSSILISNCTGNIATTGVTMHVATGAGGINYRYSVFTNTGLSTTPSSTSVSSVNHFYTEIQHALSTSSTGALGFDYCYLDTSATNTTCMTSAGSGQIICLQSFFASGTASALSIGVGTVGVVDNSVVNSTNTNAITGAGTLHYSEIAFQGSSSTINTVTQTKFAVKIGSLALGTALPVTSGGTGVTASTGTVAVVLSNSPTLVTPVLGVASATSINFGGTALSVYEEGTFTPTITGASVAGTTTYNAQTGFYTKIGNTVYIYAFISYSAATGTGNMVLGGLPFTIKNQANYSPVGSVGIFGSAFPAGATSVTFFGTANTTTAVFVGVGTLFGGGDVQMANIANSIYLNVSYQV